MQKRSSEPKASGRVPTVDAPLFFLDYDGTLAPIVDDPAAAHPHPAIPALLRDLAARHPVWIVTGRDLADVETFFEQAGLLDLRLPAIGLHGTQEGVLGNGAESLASEEATQALAERRGALPPLEGVEVEDKGHAFAVHYRAAPDEGVALGALRDWTEEMPEALEAIWGKKVVELRPRGLTKGTAVRRVADRHPERTPVYLGDDTTDEDAFEALADEAEAGHAVTVRVGGGATAARYRLGGPADVARYLRRYVEEA
ncbi:MAG: trehalose-phosphatase [Bacteroidetes bacterium QS_9_68_14]|nr:MAG: trehalose-phosphatase [Bacteroidetes bacterium QS_9_68_14]